MWTSENDCLVNEDLQNKTAFDLILPQVKKFSEMEPLLFIRHADSLGHVAKEAGRYEALGCILFNKTT